MVNLNCFITVSNFIQLQSVQENEALTLVTPGKIMVNETGI